MPELLELPHLVDEHGVPEMQIGCRRIEARLDPQRTPTRQFPFQVRREQDLVGTAGELRHLFRY